MRQSDSWSDIYFFFFNDTATTEIYTLSLHDALPICPAADTADVAVQLDVPDHHSDHHRDGDSGRDRNGRVLRAGSRSEEHTSELQSRQYLVCRLLLEKKTAHLIPFFLLVICKRAEFC